MCLPVGSEGIDLYAYVTFTAPPHGNVSGDVAQFIDRLQEIHPNLPLRTVPLKIEAFTPTLPRMTTDHHEAIQFQYEIHAAWLNELDNRFTDAERRKPICDVSVFT